MSGPSKRDRAVAEMERALRRARLSLEPDLGDVGLLVDLIVDAAAERIREDRGRARRVDPDAIREQDRRIREAPGHREAMAYIFGGPEGLGTCGRCGEPFEPVRPGKSRPTCDCYERDV